MCGGRLKTEKIVFPSPPPQKLALAPMFMRFCQMSVQGDSLPLRHSCKKKKNQYRTKPKMLQKSL